jgi:manganese transport protein
MSARGEGKNQRAGDERTIQVATDILSGESKKRGLARLLPFLGPAFIASVAYIDPGNFATNIAGGAQLGYTLLWVILASNLMAMLIQSLSAKLGIATGHNLAEHCRSRFPRPLVIFMWVIMELVAMATDLAEFLGAALGFNLLLGVPLWLAGILTAIATFLILGLERYGFRPLEAVIAVLVGVVASSYVVEVFMSGADVGGILHGAFVPSFGGSGGILLATGILGATVMPHAIYLHSALTQDRIVVREPKMMRRLFRYEVMDVLVAMGLASLINAAMLIMAAATFHATGRMDVGTIEQAYQTLTPLLGGASSAIFAISLLAAGLSSASVGTMAGQVIMQGFLHREIPVWVRRLVTMTPSLIIIFMGLEPTRVLVISQVVLSFGLPFAIIPLLLFTSRKDLMGVLVNKRITSVILGVIAALIVLLNVFLLISVITGGG